MKSLTFSLRKRSPSPRPLPSLKRKKPPVSYKNEPTQLISRSVTGNILRTLKTTAKLEGKKYQSMIIEMIRDGLKAKK
ncbi:MAG: hypothetical protein KF789_00650 [Bdellovibrionaceae bacterium]|nr:hypothetical protein [Pseudobdellovibrionaceae bacterium]